MLRDELRFHYIVVLVDSAKVGLVISRKVFWEHHFRFCVSVCSQLLNLSALTCCNYLCQNILNSFFCVRESFKKPETSVGRPTLRKRLGSGSKQPKIFLQHLSKKPVSCVEICLQTLSVVHVKQFWYQLILAISGDRRGKVTVVEIVLSSHEKKLSLVLHSIKNLLSVFSMHGSEPLRWVEAAFFAFKLILVKIVVRGLKTTETLKESRRNISEESP